MHPLIYATIAHHAQRLRLIRIKDWADARYLATYRRAMERAVSEGRVDISALDALARRGIAAPTRRDVT